MIVSRNSRCLSHGVFTEAAGAMKSMEIPAEVKWYARAVPYLNL